LGLTLICNLAETSKKQKMKIALFGKNFSGERVPFFRMMLDSLVDSGAELCIYKPYLDQVKPYLTFPTGIPVYTNHIDLPKDVDILFSVGGDGTLLDTLPLVRNSGIPVLGINMGRLGFLSSISKQEVVQAIEAIFNKRYTLESRSLLLLENPEGIFTDINYALNEVTVFRKETTSLIVIQVFVDEVFVNSYWADGLIVATPTGSTAYSLSAGGPILVPSACDFVITPIATHNLSVRPIVIPDKSTVRLKVVGRHTQFTISMDSRIAIIDQSTDIVINKAPFGMKLVKMEDRDFFGTIREKLLWGLDVRN
jgi:NAD+ kinase